MITRPYISLIYPAYNEASTIRETLRKTIDYFLRRGLTYEIILAADGDDGDSRLRLIRRKLRNVRDILRIRLETRAAVHAHRSVAEQAEL